MCDTKHTPGPWVVRLDEGVFKVRGSVPGLKYKIADVYGWLEGSCGPESEVEANAELIASAPKLAAENARMREMLGRIVRANEDVSQAGSLAFHNALAEAATIVKKEEQALDALIVMAMRDAREAVKEVRDE